MSQGEGGGRPLKFKTVAIMQKKIDEYFAECDPHVVEVTEWVEARSKDGKLLKNEHGLNYLHEITHKKISEQIPYTITGLALALDTNRQTLLEYEGEVEGRKNKDPRFADTIKRAKLKIENYHEQKLSQPSPVGTIFNLKNNYGWKDKSETDITSGGEKLKTALVEFVDGSDPEPDQDTDTQGV